MLYMPCTIWSETILLFNVSGFRAEGALGLRALNLGFLGLTLTSHKLLFCRIRTQTHRFCRDLAKATVFW